MRILASEDIISIALDNEEFFRLVPKVCADTKVQKDDGEKLVSFVSKDNIYTWEVTSANFLKKIYTLTVNDNSAVFKTKLIGKCCIGNVRWFAESDFDTSYYYSPYIMGNGKVNSCNNMSDSDKNVNGYFIPPPLCYVFGMEGNNTLLGAGLCERAGKYNFSHFWYEFESDTMSLTTDYNGYTYIDGEYDLPDIVFFEGNDRFEIYRKYSEFNFENGYTVRAEHKRAEWWKGPFFCGWGDQWNIARDVLEERQSGWQDIAVVENAENDGHPIFNKAIAAATEKNYRLMLKTADEKNIPYNTIIIDCKWNIAFGTMEADTRKWSDLRSFIDEQHAKNVKVLLWFNFWSAEGLPDDECIMVNGKPFSPDPTNEKYLKHFEEILHKVLSSDKDCYDADGFKIDFMHVPDKENMIISQKGIYGIELIKKRLQHLYDTAHAIKEDVLINTQCVHPYFDECTDMMRIGDYWYGSNNASSNLESRVGVLKAVLPDVMIDMDSAGCIRRRDALMYFRKEVQLGVPVLYGTRTYPYFDENDWKEISELFYGYIERAYV